MINKKLLAALLSAYRANESERRQIIAAANDILFEAKRGIFALHRQDFKGAAAKLAGMEESLANMEKRFGPERLYKEGSFKAAAEEYVECRTFYDVIRSQEIKPVKELHLDYESYLGGICDLIGELVRYATNQAAAGKFAAVAQAKARAEEIMAPLIDFDFTSYLRTKYDQARGHLRKLEQMSYEIRLRRRK